MNEFSVIDGAIGSLRENEVICEVHGRTRAASVFGREARCLRCIEDDVVREEKSRLREQHASDEKRRMDIVLRQSGIPERYWGATFDHYILRDNPDQASVVSLSKLFADSAVSGWRSLTLYGSPGTGKTHLACSIMLAMMGSGASARYIPFHSLVDRFSKTRSFSAEISRDDLLKEILVPDLLVIDEVGVCGLPEDQMLATSYDVINARYNAMKPVVICSNGSISDMRVLLGDRVIERLRENDGRFLKMDWVSFRKEGGS